MDDFYSTVVSAERSQYYKSLYSLRYCVRATRVVASHISPLSVPLILNLSMNNILFPDSEAVLPNDHCRTNVSPQDADNNDLISRNTNGKLESEWSLTDSINLIGEASVSNIPNTNLQTCQQLFNSESSLLRNGGYRKSFPHSVSLPIIATSCVDPSLVESIANELKTDSCTHVNVVTACTDEEETLFNRSYNMKKQSSVQPGIHKEFVETLEDDSSEHKHKHDKIEIIGTHLQIDNNKSLNAKEQGKEDSCKENDPSKSNPSTSRRDDPTSRTTLADDSKLVKMSLLTNPMNLMQSNAQLINKSRNFLNFITEKSTNIMEKALLPQHLAMKSHHTTKSVETGARSCANNESAARDVESSINLTNSNNILNAQSCSTNETDNGRNELDDAAINENNVKANEMCTDLKLDKRQLLHNNRENNEEISNERKHTDETNNTGISECGNNIAAQIKCDASSTEANEDKYTWLQTGKIDDDKCTADSEEKLDRSDKSFQAARTDAFVSQVENLEKIVNKLSADLNESLSMQQVLKKECLASNKEKENMVMKYAISEKQLIDSRRYIKKNIYLVYALITRYSPSR